MKRMHYKMFLLFAFLLLSTGWRYNCPGIEPPELPVYDPDPPLGHCEDYNPLRNPYFGDLHVHTTLSFDAANFSNRTDPYDAYNFAQGEEIGLPPYDGEGNPTRTIRLRRPLDFAAVTDHSEFLEETSVCTDPTSFGYDSSTCVNYRGEGDQFNLGSFLVFGLYIILPNPGIPPLCLFHPYKCANRFADAWIMTLEAAEAAYDRSPDCSFTSFVGYEYTGSTNAVNLHRNVIFRGSEVAYPISYLDAPTAEQLWKMLDATCTDTGNGCELLTIPHNTNLGGGKFFNPLTEAGNPYSAVDAGLRARMEPLMEIYQHKGASECTGGNDPLSSEDELCGFELIGPGVCTGSPEDDPNCVPLCSDQPNESSFLAFVGSCVQPSDFARGMLRNGLTEQSRTGVNPFKMGFIGSTDTHNSTPGYVLEDDFKGHHASSDDTLEERLGGMSNFEGIIGILADLLLPNTDFNKFYGAGALAVIWAEQNTRNALFDAMKRRETYATSGPRMIVRFFGGWEYPEDLCSDTNLVHEGYTGGVPMGGDLAAKPAGAGAPKFVVSALRDSGTIQMPGTPLQRIQIIKGWMEKEGTGETREQVYDVAGDPDNGAGVDLTTCESTGSGFDSLCMVWTDPDFDPDQLAFYYARVLENPVCRWSQRQCNDAGVDCSTMALDDPLYDCCNGTIPSTIQERAWTSPIWYTP